MKLQYLVGCGISIAVSVATLALKAHATKYPGVGDFMLILLTGGLLGNLLPSNSFFTYLPKGIVAVGLFSLFYALCKKTGHLRLPCAFLLTTGVLVIMSLGEAVVG